MTYELYRVASPCDDVSDATLLGEYETFDAALEARDDDTVRLFSTTLPGDVLLACHQILGPGAQGLRTPHPVTTELPRHPTRDSTSDVAETQAWLRRIHARQL